MTRGRCRLIWRSAKREGNFRRTLNTDCVKRRPAVLGKQIMICDDCWEIKADAGGIGFLGDFLTNRKGGAAIYDVRNIMDFNCCRKCFRK